MNSKYNVYNIHTVISLFEVLHNLFKIKQFLNKHLTKMFLKSIEFNLVFNNSAPVPKSIDTLCPNKF